MLINPRVIFSNQKLQFSTFLCKLLTTKHSSWQELCVQLWTRSTCTVYVRRKNNLKKMPVRLRCKSGVRAYYFYVHKQHIFTAPAKELHFHCFIPPCTYNM